MVNIYLRVFSRPRVDKLPVIFQKYNTNWEDRVIPSIGNEVLKSVVAQYNAEQLLSMREQILVYVSVLYLRKGRNDDATA